MKDYKQVIDALEILGNALKDSGLHITSHPTNEFMVTVKDNDCNIVYENSILDGTLHDISKAFGDSIQLKGIKGV